MTIGKHVGDGNIYRAVAAAQAMQVSGATTAEDVVAAVSPALTSGCTSECTP